MNDIIISSGQLKSLIEHVERLNEERLALTNDTKEVYNEAKAIGFDTKAIRKIVALRKKKQYRARTRRRNSRPVSLRIRDGFRMIQNRKRGKFAKGKTRSKIERQLEAETHVDVSAISQSLAANLIGIVALAAIFAYLVGR